MKDRSIMSVDELADYLVAQGRVRDTSEFHAKVETKMKEVMRLLFLQVKDKLDRLYGCFELFGFDLLIDDDLGVHLIEINTNPALFTDTTVQKEMLPKLVDDVVGYALELHEAGKEDGN